MIYARQVPPDIQESPFDQYDGCWEEISIMGNRHYTDRQTTECLRIFNHFDELVENLESVGTENSWYKDDFDCIQSIMDLNNLTEEGVKEWKKLVSKYLDNGERISDDVVLTALQLMTGTEHKHKTIRGSCQGDWQGVYYPVTYTDKDIEILETEYFNTGSEWIVHDSDDEMKTADDINGYAIYCYGWNDDIIKKEIAEASDVEPSEVVLFSFDGYRQVATYKEG